MEGVVTMPEPEPIDRPALFSRRTLMALAGGASAIFVIPAAIALSSNDDDDDHDDDHNDDHADDDEGKVAPLGTVPAGSMEVRIVDDDADAFKPQMITIDLGQSVTFVNRDDDPHTATGMTFDTGSIAPGEQVTVTFDKPGVFPYSCQYHPMMTGSVSVRNEQGEVPGASPSASPVASPDAAAAGNTVEVAIVNFAFDPAEIEISAGTTVRWTNKDSVPHTATADDGAFDTGVLQQGDTATHTFAGTGAFTYICAFHPSMTGTVTVT
jgi:plastocyanin